MQKNTCSGEYNSSILTAIDVRGGATLLSGSLAFAEKTTGAKIEVPSLGIDRKGSVQNIFDFLTSIVTSILGLGVCIIIF